MVVCSVLGAANLQAFERLVEHSFEIPHHCLETSWISNLIIQTLGDPCGKFLRSICDALQAAEVSTCEYRICVVTNHANMSAYKKEGWINVWKLLAMNENAYKRSIALECARNVHSLNVHSLLFTKIKALRRDACGRSIHWRQQNDSLRCDCARAMKTRNRCHPAFVWATVPWDLSRQNSITKALNFNSDTTSMHAECSQWGSSRRWPYSAFSLDLRTRKSVRKFLVHKLVARSNNAWEANARNPL